MQRFLSSKIMVIGVLMMLFLIGFSFIGTMIDERQRSYQQVITDIERDNVKPQTVMMPFIVVPMNSSYVCTDDQKKTCYSHQQIVITPEKAIWNNSVSVDDQAFKRGIYHAMSYQNKINIEGDFVLPDVLLKPTANQTIDWQNAKMRVYLSDLRGLKSQPSLTIGSQILRFEFAKEEGVNPLNLAYTQVSLLSLQQTPRIKFSLTIDMIGTSSFQALPLGNDLTMKMTANWPHPSFYGESLPSKQITSKGFVANWQNTFITNRNSQLLSACMDANTNVCNQLQKTFQRQPHAIYAEEVTTQTVGSFGVSFIQAVDAYLMTERTVKYALLFLVITFGTFFLFEILKSLAIHPMQYALVGAALAVFYLLLLSFSEHIAFMTAYIIASVACVLLITFYVSYVLQSVARSLIFGGVLTVMYATLSVILQSEDFTLILGSVLVFALIAVMMFLTRHVDWYRLGEKQVQQTVELEK